MKVTYLITALTLIGLVGVLGACGQKGTSSGNSATSQSESSEFSFSSVDRSQEPSEVLSGKVKEATNSTDQRLVLESLVPEDKESETFPFDEVVLLTEGVTIVDGSDKEISVDQIKVGDTIKVTLIKNSPVASSLPPQIPGMSMIKIVVP